MGDSSDRYSGSDDGGWVVPVVEIVWAGRAQSSELISHSSSIPHYKPSKYREVIYNLEH